MDTVEEKPAVADVVFFASALDAQIWSLYELYQNYSIDASFHHYLHAHGTEIMAELA